MVHNSEIRARVLSLSSTIMFKGLYARAPSPNSRARTSLSCEHKLLDDIVIDVH